MQTVFGEYVESPADYAKRLIAIGINQPIIYIRVNSINFVQKHLSLSFFDKEGNNVSYARVPGLYSIYEHKPSVFSYGPELLYLGYTDCRVSDRIHKFMRGLTGILRPGERHPAGVQCAKDGVDMHSIAFRFLPTVAFPAKSTQDKYKFDDKYLDEYLVPILKPKYNKMQRF